MSSLVVLMGIILTILLLFSPFWHMLDKNSWKRRRMYVRISVLLSYVIGFYLVAVSLFSDPLFLFNYLLTLFSLGGLIGTMLAGLLGWSTWEILNVVHDLRQHKQE